MKSGIFLLLGTNLGNRLENIQKAIAEIESRIGLVIARSKVYQTAPWGRTGQPDFFNQVIQLSSDLPPYDLLSAIQQIEKKLGRQRDQRWGARTIDIDILFFNDEIIESPNLTIPHPAMEQRRFTLVPLAEMAPFLRHPKSHKTMVELLKGCLDPLKVEEVKDL
jgi:2-amino-4-hydroxy-6-hydroxymethyldihydropteridine diphosphokinase